MKVFEQNTTTVAQQMYPIDSSSAPAAIFYHHHQQHDVVQNDDDDNTNNINIPSLDHLGLHLPSSLHGFNPQVKLQFNPSIFRIIYKNKKLILIIWFFSLAVCSIQWRWSPEHCADGICQLSRYVNKYKLIFFFDIINYIDE